MTYSREVRAIDVIRDTCDRQIKPKQNAVVCKICGLPPVSRFTAFREDIRELFRSDCNSGSVEEFRNGARVIDRIRGEQRREWV